MTIYMETGTKFHAICWTRESANNLYKGQDGKYKGPYTLLQLLSSTVVAWK